MDPAQFLRCDLQWYQYSVLVTQIQSLESMKTNLTKALTAVLCICLLSLGLIGCEDAEDEATVNAEIEATAVKAMRPSKWPLPSGRDWDGHRRLCLEFWRR